MTIKILHISPKSHRG